MKTTEERYREILREIDLPGMTEDQLTDEAIKITLDPIRRAMQAEGMPESPAELTALVSLFNLVAQAEQINPESPLSLVVYSGFFTPGWAFMDPRMSREESLEAAKKMVESSLRAWWLVKDELDMQNEEPRH